MTRIQIELPDEKVRALEELMEEAGLRTKKDLISNALTLLVWAVREVKKGRVIASVDERDNRYQQILLPALENMFQANVENVGKGGARTERARTAGAALVKTGH
jgi:hypothetical protein